MTVYGEVFTIAPETRQGSMVSVKTDKGWRIFYGPDPRETLIRALSNGPQLGDTLMGDEVWQNRTVPKDGPDDFPTQPWATRAMLHHILPRLPNNITVWEPAANRGFMTRVLMERFSSVISSDLHDYGVGFPVIDFLNGPSPADYGVQVDWIITNPPYNKALEFVLRALEVAQGGVAMLLRTQWLEGGERYEKLFSKTPPTYITQYVERVGFDHGTVTQKGARQVPYCWVIWDKSSDLTWPRLRWIPPSKVEMERPDDYAHLG